MAEPEMAENNAYISTLDAVQAQLGERVTNLGRRQTDLEAEMRSGFRQIEQSIAGLSSTILERSRPQWQAIGVALTFSIVIGGMAYWPIREATVRLETSTMRLSETVVTREELKWRAERAAEERLKVDETIRDIRSKMLPRNEWSERNLNRDSEVTNIRESQLKAVDNLQRQIDQQRADFQSFASSLGNGRDFIQDLKEEQSRLRDQLAELRSRLYVTRQAIP